jgi:hypothetical protein
MDIDKKELFNYLDNYIFDSQSELKWEINQWICMKFRTKYYNEWTITEKLYDEYLDYKTK